jgi:acyl-CoA synthetase (AMP-forming)/AMP-acid ligase II
MASLRTTLPAHWVDVLRHHAQQTPDALSFAYLNQGTTISKQLTFGQLDRRARAIASTLQDQDLAGQRVLLLFPNDLDYIATFMGCLYAGVTAVPVYPPQMGRQIDRMLSIRTDSGAKAMLTSAMVLSMIQARVPELMEAPEAWIATDEIPDSAAEEWLSFSPHGDDLAFLQYTSGSTGQPKGVRITHGNLLHNQEVIKGLFRTDSSMVGVGWLPLYHDMGLIGNILHSLYLGTPFYLMSPLTFLQNPLHWLSAISTFRGTVSGGPNFAYDLCVKKISEEDAASLDLSSWEAAFSGAEPVQAATMRRFTEAFEVAGFRQRRFLPCYGLAEATLAVSGRKATPGSEPQILSLSRSALRQHSVQVVEPGSEDAQALVGCGEIGEGLTLHIVDPEQRAPLPEGQIGEIWVQGDSMGQGYWQQPELSREVFQAEIPGEAGVFMRTGDLGFLHEGQLYLTGRRKDLIIIRGKNHYPQDIETTVGEAHELLRVGAGVAVGIEVDGEERLLILQEVQRGQLSEPEGEQCLASIREAVSTQHELLPHAIVLLPRKSVLKTSSGKLQRSATREAYLAGQLNTLAHWEVAAASSEEAPAPEPDLSAVPRPQGAADIQRWIIAWLARKLQMRVSDIRPEDPINVYGVDSMMIQEFEAEVSQYLGFQWPVSDLLLTEPSIEEIAERGAERLEDQ